MKSEDSTFEQDEQSSVEFSLQLELIASIVGIIAQALSMLAVLEEMEETKVAFEEEKENQRKFDEQFNNLQDQINHLTKELTAIKLTNQNAEIEDKDGKE